MSRTDAPTDENGRPAHRQAVPWPLFVPRHLRLRTEPTGFWLDWSPPGEGSEAEVVEEVRALNASFLFEFLDLASVNVESEDGAQKVLAFARRHGVLRFCWHYLPAAHSPYCEIDPAPPHMTAMKGEPVAFYGHWSRVLRSIHDIGRALWDGREGTLDAWLTIRESALAEPVPPVDGYIGLLPEIQVFIAHRVRRLQGTRESRVPADLFGYHVDDEALEPLSEREMLARTLNTLLQLSNVRPAIEWLGSRPDFRLGGGHLPGALAFELLLVTSRAEGSAWCSVCGRPYLPRRRPRAGQLRYCDICRTEGSRLRMREHRKHRSQAGDRQ